MGEFAHRSSKFRLIDDSFTLESFSASSLCRCFIGQYMYVLIT